MTSEERRARPRTKRAAPKTKLLGVIVPPVPVGLLVFVFQLRVIDMGTVSFRDPGIVMGPFGWTPSMVVPMIHIIVASVNCTAGNHYRSN